ncbi:MAG: hypothetical protein KF729_31125 [Sandaracinaceae bacterium]|nr:hypothetical protein [Sandaracinaceae bacterium]
MNYRAIAPAREAVRLDKPGHHRLESGRMSGWIALELTAVDAVHVGAGAPVLYEELARATVVTFDEDGGVAPVIPGASLKGAVRNLAELVLGGGSPDDRDVASTAVGSLFGYVAGNDTFLGRIGFDDALPLAEEPAMGLTKLPHPYQPRKAGGRRLYGPPVGALAKEVPYEVTAPKERFGTRLHLVNVAMGELGAVLTCLGMDGTFLLRVGGGKFAGLGRVRVEAVGGSIRRGYERPRPERLDAEAARKLVAEALAKRTLAKDAEQPLRLIRQALGGAR